jgi:hypothetical protein
MKRDTETDSIKRTDADIVADQLHEIQRLKARVQELEKENDKLRRQYAMLVPGSH